MDTSLNLAAKKLNIQHNLNMRGAQKLKISFVLKILAGKQSCYMRALKAESCCIDAFIDYDEAI